MAFPTSKKESHFYTIPATSPLFGPPPYKYRGNRQATIMFKTTPEAIAKLIPAPLEANPQQLMAAYYSTLTMSEPYEFVYREVGVFAPVALKGVPGLFFVCMYLDSAPGLACGREIWGFPKKDAEIDLAEDGTRVSTKVRRMGATIMKAEIELQTKLEAFPQPPFQAYFNLKTIPSIRRGAPPEVLQLTTTPILTKTTEMRVGVGSLEFVRSAADPLQDIPILAVTHAQFVVQDMTLDCGEVAVDYLKPSSD